MSRALRHAVGAAVRERALWSPGDRVAVAVSGGLDSVCLLDLLRETRAWHGGVLSVVTIDHGLHGESGAHADHVAAIAGELPLTRLALGLGAASEAEARRARYAALDALETDRVALAHHRDDQAETVLIRLLRGAGSAAGMPWRRGRYVRPLLDVGRAELRAWAEARGLRWVEDPTNTDPRYLRNRVRAEVMPLLERLRPGATDALARAARLSADDDALLRELAGAPAEPWPVAWLVETPEPLARRALLAALPEAGAAHVDAVLAAARRGHGDVALPGGRWVRVGAGRVKIVDEGRPGP